MFTQIERMLGHDDLTIRNKIRSDNIIFDAMHAEPATYKMTGMQRFDLSKIKMLIVTALAVTGRSARSVSIEAGMGPDTLGKFLKGDTVSLRADNMARVLEILEIEDQVISAPGKADNKVPGIRYGGIVEAGTFRKVNGLNQDAEFEIVPLPPNPLYPAKAQYAFRVEGDSMNLADMAPGMWVQAVDLGVWERTNGEPGDGTMVIVELRRNGDSERELCVKQLRLFRDRYELHPHSSNPAHKPIAIPYEAANDFGDRHRIIAVVLTATKIYGYKGP